MRILFISLLTQTIIFASLPSLNDTIIPPFWYYLGPFSVAPREGITGIDEEEIMCNPDTTKIYRTIFTDSGIVKWQRVERDSLDWVRVEYEEILWDTILDFYGFSLIQSLTYFWTEVTVEEECRALIMSEKASFILNGLSYPGDPYGHNFVLIPVTLRKGKNSILAKVAGFPPHRFKFGLFPAKNPIEIIKGDITAPTLIPGRRNRVLLGVPVLNTEDKNFQGLKMRIQETEIEFSLSPQVIKKLPVEFFLDVPKDDSLIKVNLEIRDGDSILLLDSFNLAVARVERPQRMTFVSQIDSSVQYFALRFPANYEEDKRYALIVSLHGAGVDAYSLANCYSPKDWAFIVCPTNRRPFGFDWQDWGRLDALEVIDYIKENFPIDTNRIYLTGHSMGGHGVWHIGLLYPSLFAAIAPGAGWPSHQLYVPWNFQKSEIFAERPILAIRDRVLRIDNPLNLIDNALNLPVFIFHGERDDNVPTLFARMFAFYLERLGYKYEYKEVRGKRHWYNLDGDIVCVDDPEIMDFFRQNVRNPFPRQVIFKTLDPDVSNRAYWLTLLELERDQVVAEIAGEIKGETIRIRTENTKRFQINLPPHSFPSPFIILEINGKTQKIRFGPDLVFQKEGRFYSLRPKKYNLTPPLRGPMRKAYFTPFLLVYGTKSDTAAKITYHQAKREAIIWWRIGNGRCEILPDTLVSEKDMERYNLIIFGGPGANYLSERLERRLPISERDCRLRFFNKEWSGDLSYRYIYPNPMAPKRFILISGGTNIQGLKLSTFFSTLHSGAGLPDFIIFSPEVERKGWGGVLAAGFFERDLYKIPSDCYIREMESFLPHR